MQRGDDQLRARRSSVNHASQAAEAIGWAGRKRLVAADRAQRPPGKAGGANQCSTYLHIFFQIGFRRLPDVCSGLICLIEWAVSQIRSTSLPLTRASALRMGPLAGRVCCCARASKRGAHKALDAREAYERPSSRSGVTLYTLTTDRTHEP